MILKSKNKNFTNIRLFSIKNIDINKIVVSNKNCFDQKGFKYFIGYKDVKIRPLCIFLQKMSAYRRDFDETIYMSFFTKDDELLQNYKEL